MSHSAEYFRRVILSCCFNFGYRKILDKRGEEYQYFPSKIFCLTEPIIFVGESFPVALISSTEKVWTRGGGGVSRYSVEKILFHSAEKIRRESFTVALISGTEKVWIGGGEGECRDIPSENFCLTVPIIFVGNPFLLH